MQFEHVKLEHVGAGGSAEDVPLVEEIETALSDLATRVTDVRSIGPGTITITIKVTKADECSVLISGDVKVRLPRMRRKELSAILDEHGDLLTAQHRQTALEFPRAIASSRDA